MFRFLVGRVGFEPTFSTTATVLVFIRHRWYLPKFCWRGGIRTHLLVSPLRRFVKPDQFYRLVPLLSNLISQYFKDRSNSF